MSAKEARTMDTFIHYGIAAAAQAVAGCRSAHWRGAGRRTGTRIACVIGSGIGGLPLIENTHTEFDRNGARRITPFLCQPPSST
jgi:3-oxoacyl-[acyl-carrier-protein] synthase II